MTLDLPPHALHPKSHRILVVDDVPENLSLLSTMLGEEGYEVRRAPNGSMALQNVPRYQPHLILLDIMMPGMSGYEVCKLLKENPTTAPIPIIFLSALNEPFDKVKAFQLGGSDYITKPFDVAEVLARVKQQLDLQDLRLMLESQNLQLKEEIEERSRAEEKAFKASQAKSDFLARMSHELRTPLSTIIGYADLMSNDRDRSPDDYRSLKAILNSASHLLTLIEDVLNMTKIESGHTNIYEKVFDFQEFLNNLEEMFRLQADVKGIQFEVKSISPLPLYIQSDDIKLRQVLINLISNALKFTVKGAVILSARAWFWSDRLVSESIPESRHNYRHNCLLQFQVQDTGPGISPEEQSSLFQAFSQTQTGRLAQTGSGLGLAISRNFIRLMGGDIFVNSVPQQGTCFTVEVLVKSLCAPPKTTLANPTVFPPFPCLWRVLLLLHTPDLEHWLPQFLQRAGWDVSRWNTPEDESHQEGVQNWTSQPPHLLLVEWGPDPTIAFQVIQHLRALHSDLPPDSSAQTQDPAQHKTLIVAIVPDSLLENAPKILEQGCDSLLLPPHHPQKVLEHIYAAFFQQKPDAFPQEFSF